jgi:CarD family transcriptional regulator
MATKKTYKFKARDKVVHPHHGAATVKRRTKKKVLDKNIEYYVLEIATEPLTVLVPVDRVDGIIRPVISKTAAKKVFATFREEPQDSGSNWSRWYKVLNEKMTSGDIYQVAEVVRDLTFAQQTKGISPALKRMLSKARLTLSSELQFALESTEEEVIKKIDKALPKIEVAEE